MLYNRFNWFALARALFVFRNPIAFAYAIATQRVPRLVVVRTPVGPCTIQLRNFESLKTVFSVFCRHDYNTSSAAPIAVLDVGANIGVAAVYFLTRNVSNTVKCYEPDPANLPYLRSNLALFRERAAIVEHAVGVRSGTCTLFRSEDGKYSSTLASERAVIPASVVVDEFAEILRDVRRTSLPVVVKLDVEGIEADLVRSVRFEQYPHIQRLVCESLECAQFVTRAHSRKVRSGYIEDLDFSDSRLVAFSNKPIVKSWIATKFRW